MERNTLVSLMLVIAAVMLAIGLFIAGSIWRSRGSPKPIGQGAAIFSLGNASLTGSTNFVRLASSKRGNPSATRAKRDRER